MVKVVLAVDGIATGMVFLDVWEVGHVAVCLAVASSCNYVVICVVSVLHVGRLWAAHVDARCGKEFMYNNDRGKSQSRSKHEHNNSPWVKDSSNGKLYMRHA